VRSRAETVNPKPARVAGLAIRPIAEKAGAKERCKIDIAILIGETKAVSSIRGDELSVAAVDRVTGKARAIAKVLAIRSAITAFAVGPAEPGNANAIAD
jgi:hypothetical protein